MFKKPVVDCETAHYDYDYLRDLSAISCDLAIRLVVHGNLVARELAKKSLITKTAGSDSHHSPAHEIRNTVINS